MLRAGSEHEGQREQCDDGASVSHSDGETIRCVVRLARVISEESDETEESDLSLVASEAKWEESEEVRLSSVSSVSSVSSDSSYTNHLASAFLPIILRAFYSFPPPSHVGYRVDLFPFR